MNKLKELRLPIKESYLLIIIIIGIISLCMYSSFALFSLEKTSKNDIVTMSAASDIQTNLSIYEYQEVKVAAGESTTLTINVTNDTGGSIYYGVFYEMLSPSTKTDDITIAKIDWSSNATSGSITNGSKLPVELVIVNNSSSEISLNIGVAGSDSNELGLTAGKTLIIDTFNTGKVISEVSSSIPSIDTTATSAKPGTDLKSLVTCEDAGNGCKILFTKPSNTANLTSEKTYTVIYLIEDNSGNRYKYKKSVEVTNALRGNVVNAVINADDGSAGDSGSGVYKVHHDAIAAANSAIGKNIPDIDDYRFYGNSPNNYVCLDMAGATKCPTKHLYRMIGTEYNAPGDKQNIKIIGDYIVGTPTTTTSSSSTTKSSSSTSKPTTSNIETFNWYTYAGTSTNQWSMRSSSNTGDSRIAEVMKAALTGKTYSYTNNNTNVTLSFSNSLSTEAKNMINATMFTLGGYPKSSQTSFVLDGDLFYKYERGNAIAGTGSYFFSRWFGMAGLMYPSDLAYAAGKECSSTATNGKTYTSSSLSKLLASCSGKNWLSPTYSSGGEWLMTPASDTTTYGYAFGKVSTYTTGYSLMSTSTTATLRIRPVMNLKPTVKITGGQGTSSSPYILSIE